MTTAPSPLWQRYAATRDPDARAELLQQHLGLVHHVVRQIAARVGDALTYDDLLGAGTLGLVQALEGFDLSRGLAFATFATQRIRGAVLDELRAADWRPRSVRTRAREVAGATAAIERRSGRPATPQEVAHEMNVDLNTYWQWRSAAEGGVTVPLDGTSDSAQAGAPMLAETLPDVSLESADDAITTRERHQLLRDAVASLPEQQRTVLTLYYYEELNLRQIAEVMHVTESRISQVRTAALKSLRARAGAELAL